MCGRWAGDLAFTHRDGREGTCETVIVPLWDETRELAGFIWAIGQIQD